MNIFYYFIYFNIYLILRQYWFYAYNLKIIIYNMENTQFSKYIDAVLTQYSAGSISKEVAI
jgi:hypothetical protein